MERLNCRRRTFMAGLIGATVAPVRTSADQTNDTWSYPRADPQNTGHSPIAGPANNFGIDWKQSFDAQISTAPIAYSGSNYLGTRDGRITALDTTSGNETWTTRVDETPFLIPTPTDQQLFFPTQESSVYSLDRTTGKKNWQRNIDESIDSPLMRDSSQLLFGTSESGTEKRSVVSLDRDDGSRRWVAPVQSRVKSPPALVGDTALVRDQSGVVTALNTETGDQRWQRTFGTNGLLGSFKGPVVRNGIVYVCSVDTDESDRSQITALKVDDGTIVWRREIRGTVFQLVSSPEYLYSVHGNGLYALDPSDGTTVWNVELDTLAYPASVTDALYVRTDDAVTVRDPQDGTERGRFDLNNGILESIPEIGDEKSFSVGPIPIPGGALIGAERTVYALRGGQGGQDTLRLAGGVGFAGLCLYALHRWHDRYPSTDEE